MDYATLLGSLIYLVIKKITIQLKPADAMYTFDPNIIEIDLTKERPMPRLNNLYNIRL